MTCQQVSTVRPIAATCCSSSSSVHKIHRDQHQIRHRLLHRLGIDKPSITMGTVRTIPKLSTKNHRHASSSSSSSSNNDVVMAQHDGSSSYQMALQQPQAQHECTFASSSSSQPCGDDDRNRRVKFAPMVAVQEIPSHRAYNDETRRHIWMGSSEIETNARRNRIEYLADGCDYRKATEENRMMRWRNDETGKFELVHPATYWLRYQEEQDRILLEEHQDLFVATGGSSHNIKSSSLVGMDTTMSIKKSPTVTSLAGMAA